MVSAMGTAGCAVSGILTEGLQSSRVDWIRGGDLPNGNAAFRRAGASPQNERRALKKYHHTPENAPWLSRICLLICLSVFSSRSEAFLCSVF